MEPQGIAYRWIVPLSLAALAFGGCSKAPPPLPPPPPVRVATVRSATVPFGAEWLATLDGSVNADIRPRVEGYIESVDYAEGTPVQRGTLLFTIDKRPLRAALLKAEGDYQSAVAQRNKAHADVKRYTPLVDLRAISREELENARAAFAAGEGSVASAQGNLETARLNLQWAEVRSPIDGLAGIAQTRVGNLVTTSQVLTTVSTVDPIRTTVPVSETAYLANAQVLNHVNDPQYADRRYLELVLANGQAHPYRARRAIVNRQIDPNTGTLQVQVLFANPGNLLRPGMFAKVRLHSDRTEVVVLCPEQAVQQLQGRYQVAVVDDSNRVQVRPVEVGRTVDHLRVVTSGLRDGERVIVEGQMNAQPGQQVEPKPAPERR